MAQTRINRKTGRKEVKIQPDGLPALWLDAEMIHCDRCLKFNQCLGLNDLTEEEWKEVCDLISSANDAEELQKIKKDLELVSCS